MSIDQQQRPGGGAGPVDALDTMEPGPELVAALDALAPASLAGEDLATYVRACARVNNRGTARLLEGMHHLGRARDGRKDRQPGLDEYSEDEVAVALGWSRTMASRKLDLADDLAVRLPEVGEALWQGLLDEPKAVRFCEWTRDLCDDHAGHVARELLPEAPDIPVGELIRRIEQVAGALDPDWAARREARATKNARVILSANPSGTATFAVCDLTAPRGLAMRDRCEALAAAVRALGVLTPVSVVRAEVASRLLDGSMAGRNDQQIALLLAAEYHASDQPPAPSGPDDEGPDDRGDGGPDDASDDDGPDDDGPDDEPDDAPDDEGPDDGGPDDGPDDEGPDDGGPRGTAREDGREDDDRADHATAARSSSGDPGSDPVGDSSSDQGVLDLPGLPGPPDPDDAPHPGEPAAADPGAPSSAGSETPALPLFAPTVDGPDPGPGRPRHGASELRLRLTTALGLDQMPATVPGYGTVLAHHARTLLLRAHHGEWRIVLTDDQGHLQHVLLARRRPRPPSLRGRSPQPPRGSSHQRNAIVELQVPTTLLGALDPHQHPGWTALLRELRDRLPELRGPGPPREHLADHARRRPNAEIGRWVRVRDRYCIIPGCRRPAHRAEIDHTHDWARDGLTAHGNLGVLCKHHHRAKHHAGWKIRQPAPGHFRIRTRAGTRLTTTPPVVLETLPEPRPARRPRPLPQDDYRTHTDDDPLWRHEFLTRTGGRTGTTRGRAASPEPRATELRADDPPPF